MQYSSTNTRMFKMIVYLSSVLQEDGDDCLYEDLPLPPPQRRAATGQPGRYSWAALQAG